ncbi:MAG: glucosaminidase domain-containing protein [Bacilli bacterium]|nr:glucosaminidase domain-containing protein [Bacilli bacterium]
MGQETIKTGEYSNFDAGAKTVDTLKSKLETENNNIDSNRTKLLNDSVFMGPIADSCGEEFDKLKNQLNLICDNFGTVSSFLTQSKSNYQTADANSKAKFLSIKENGKVAITEGLAGGYYVNPKCPKYQSDFINKILPYALNLYNEKGILPSLTIAQACKESKFGQARPGNGHNIFGIKSAGWSGKSVNARTTEDTGKSIESVNADFRDYDSYEAAVKDYGEVLSLERYDAVRSAKDYKEAAHAVKAGGYATGRNYDNSLINDYIEPYNLNQWDPVK